MRKAISLTLALVLLATLLAGCGATTTSAPEPVKETVIVKETVEVPVQETVVTKETVEVPVEVEVPAEEQLVTVLNPAGTPPPITLVPMAPRLESLAGKTIYIVSVQFPLTKPFFEEMQRLLTERYPETNWIFQEKAGTYFEDDPELWAKIKETADGAIMGMGH